MELFPLIILVVIIELLLSGGWASFYFKYGIPLYHKSVFCDNEIPDLDIDKLDKQFKSFGAPSLVFKRLDPDSIAFREKLISFSFFNYTPVMHGVIKMDTSTRTISIIGNANWFASLFIIMFIWIGLSEVKSFGEIGLMFVIMPILVFGLLYGIQVYRFNNVIQYIHRQSRLSHIKPQEETIPNLNSQLEKVTEESNIKLPDNLEDLQRIIEEMEKKQIDDLALRIDKDMYPEQYKMVLEKMRKIEGE